MIEKQPLVSVIIPVYNVEPYLDRCLKCVTEQSYPFIEIVLIDDGSTDYSLQRCCFWRDRDDRIVLFSKKNEGLGPTREFGIKVSKGEYLTFVDSDDWIESDLVERLLSAALYYDADLVSSNQKIVTYGRTKEESSCRIQNYKINYKHKWTIKEHPEALWLLGASLVGRLYKKSLLQKIELKQPAHALEDMCTAFLYYYYADGIVHLKEAFYNYCIREGSLTTSENRWKYFENSIYIIKDYFLKSGIPDFYFWCVKKIVSEAIIWKKDREGSSKDALQKTDRLWILFNRLFFNNNDTRCFKSIAIGSYNLRCSIRNYFYREPSYFGFSSLISIMSEKTSQDWTAIHANSFRRLCLSQDLNKTFEQTIQQFKDEETVVFLDFLEERFPILELKTGEYITQSDALKESKMELPPIVRVIESRSPEFIELWKDSCLKLIGLLRKYQLTKRLILVKSRLAEGYGEKEEEVTFDQLDEIRSENRMFADFAEFFEKNCPEAHVIDLSTSKLLYTHKDFYHGCYPWHLNDEYYIQMMYEIGKVLEGVKIAKPGMQGDLG